MITIIWEIRGNRIFGTRWIDGKGGSGFVIPYKKR